MATDREKLDWLLAELGVEEEWLDHAVTCTASGWRCTVELGYEYVGQSECNQYLLITNKVQFGPMPKPFESRVYVDYDRILADMVAQGHARRNVVEQLPDGSQVIQYVIGDKIIDAVWMPD